MKTSKLAPIVIFAFNRPYALKTTLESLQANIESKSSILYVFVDGPRLDNSDDSNKVFKFKIWYDILMGSNKYIMCFLIK